MTKKDLLDKQPHESKPAIKVKNAVFSLLFCAILLVLLWYSGNLVRPVWSDWNNYHTIHDFYNEPENRIEAVFLGTSMIINGISPTQIYEEEGICTYSLGTPAQPLKASYDLLREAYRRQSQTLKTAVLDVTMLTKLPEKDANYHMAIEHLQMSGLKLQILGEYTHDMNEWFDYAIPLFHYHSRWYELNRHDWSKWEKDQNYTRGYNLTGYRWIYGVSDTAPLLPYYCDYESEETDVPEDAQFWFDQIASFCEKHQLQLVLTKTPNITWTSSEHIAVEKIAQKYGLEFIDFNYVPYIDELKVNCLLDYMDGVHMNYSGAQKLSHWWGQYLIQNSDCRDVRNDSMYDYLREQSRKYDDIIDQFTAFNSYADFVDYLKYAGSIAHSLVMISACDDASYSIKEDQRTALDEMGLYKLSYIDFRDSYIGMIMDGEVILEKGQNGYDEEEAESLSETLMLENGDLVTVSSSGYGHGDETKASIIINGTEKSVNHRGLNVVVYDYEKHEVLDSTYFDTYEAALRERRSEKDLQSAISDKKHISGTDGELRKLLVYERREYNYRNVSKWNSDQNNMALFDWLKSWTDRYGYTVYISVADEASYSLTEEARLLFKKSGLAELSELDFRDSYIGIIDEGQVIYEKKDHGESPLEYSSSGLRITSGGGDSGNESKIIIYGTDYSTGGRGIHFAVYDKELMTVVCRRSFDTYEYQIDIDRVERGE